MNVSPKGRYGTRTACLDLRRAKEQEPQQRVAGAADTYRWVYSSAASFKVTAGLPAPALPLASSRTLIWPKRGLKVYAQVENDLRHASFSAIEDGQSEALQIGRFVPLSLHLAQKSSSAVQTPFFCVVAETQQLHTSEQEQHTIRLGLEALNRHRPALSHTNTADGAQLYMTTLAADASEPVATLAAGAAHVQFALQVSETALVQLTMWAGGKQLVSVPFLDALTADALFIASYAQYQHDPSRTFARHKRVLERWSFWAHNQRCAGTFRPLLKQMFWRTLPVREDADLRDFQEYAFNTRSLIKDHETSQIVFAAFKALRVGRVKHQMPMSAEDDYALMQQRYVGKSVLPRPSTLGEWNYTVLRSLAQWLYAQRTDDQPHLSLKTLCRHPDGWEKSPLIEEFFAQRRKKFGRKRVHAAVNAFARNLREDEMTSNSTGVQNATGTSS
jgi:hypothetical protein